MRDGQHSVGEEPAYRSIINRKGDRGPSASTPVPYAAPRVTGIYARYLTSKLYRAPILGAPKVGKRTLAICWPMHALNPAPPPCTVVPRTDPSGKIML